MKNIVIGLLFAATILLAPQTQAATADPLTNQSIPKQVDSDELLTLFKAAGLRRGWMVEPNGDGSFTAEIWVRSRHFVAVDIVVRDGVYDILYKDSENMNYNPDNQKIHRKYNGWVRNLNKDIQSEFVRLTKPTK
ncbi:hypothetical protein [Paraferrimonas sedimenticola]|uniref:Lipoprotein n=1 Tax=Paraferrimonas sedimenticola TaxID=375674 RepID=A0AA37RYE6_9GAMM|nr:hypothetical protein [Paraferrimonas sedimenticola]GLP97022.1 lipoprotein [Paraferrimonas sedimenticola]